MGAGLYLVTTRLIEGVDSGMKGGHCSRITGNNVGGYYFFHNFHFSPRRAAQIKSESGSESSILFDPYLWFLSQIYAYEYSENGTCWDGSL